jgi:nuclear transport factor 2 (NTF2) superfamily protein
MEGMVAAIGAPILSEKEALEMVKAAEKSFGDKDVDVIMSGFTDDIVVRFADQPELHGKEATEAWLKIRFSRQKDYRLTKTLRMLAGDMIGNSWEGEWEDAFTGKQMRGRGTEFWTLRNGKVAVWDATFNIWEKDAPPKPPLS